MIIERFSIVRTSRLQAGELADRTTEAIGQIVDFIDIPAVASPPELHWLGSRNARRTRALQCGNSSRNPVSCDSIDSSRSNSRGDG
jgi:hypothetical protein